MSEELLSPSLGLTNSSLLLATADPSDVLSGKTFYSGDKTLKTGTLTGAIIDNTFTYYSRSGSYTPCWKNYSINISLGYATNAFASITIKIGNPNAVLSSSGTLKIQCGSTVLLNTSYYRPNSSYNGGYGTWTYKYMNQLYSGSTLTVSVLNNTDDDALYVTVYGIGK